MPAPRRAPRGRPALAAAVFAACHIGAEGARERPREPWGGDIDIAAVVFEEDGILFPNGTRLHLDFVDNAAVSPDGRRWEAFDGKKPEGTFDPGDIICKDGEMICIRVPVKRRRHGVLHYLQRSHLPNIEPIEFYVNIEDVRKQFILYPPEPGLLTTYALEPRCELEGQEHPKMSRA